MRFQKCSKKLLAFSIVLLLLLVSLLYYSRVLDLLTEVRVSLLRPYVVFEEHLSVYFDDRYSLRTPGCSIERLDPWEQSLRTYFKKLPPFRCPQEVRDVLVRQLDNGTLIVDRDVLRKLMLSYKSRNASTHFMCYKREVYRLKVEDSDAYKYRLGPSITEFTKSVTMDEEYLKVKCLINRTAIYHNYFVRVKRKPEVEAECQQNRREFLKDHPQCVGEVPLSVLVIGIDSLSKSNLLRQLPKTHDYVANHLMAVDMVGYNKVGLNTFPCLMPYLTGQSEAELISGCWGPSKYNSFDNCTFLWDRFASAGYRTAFVENMDFAGLLVFNKGGSKRQVAHYYGHTVYIPTQQFALRKGCWRGESDDGQLLKWAHDFQRVFANDSHFGHFWLSGFSHDYVNLVQHLDGLLLRTLKEMKNGGLLNDTLLIFMSDHGVRYGVFRENEIGRQEENLPFMYLAFPPRFSERFSGAMAKIQSNRNRLITTFDLHEFLKSVIECEYVRYNRTRGEKEEKTRGVTLFHPISGNRTCEDAGIPLIYCACKTSMTEEDPKSKTADEFARNVVDKLNEMTEKAADRCAKFELSGVLSFKKFARFPDDPNKKAQTLVNSHLIMVKVRPGGAKFEATIQFNRSEKMHVVNPEVRRINRYGDTSTCIVNDAFLQTICFCVNRTKIESTVS